MALDILFAAHPKLWRDYEQPLVAALSEAGLEARVGTETRSPWSVDYLICAPGGPVDDFRPFTRLRAVLSLWAGVENLIANPTLTQPLCRLVDPALTEGMTEWVVGQVLRHHLGLDRYTARPSPGWVRHVPPLARERPVGVLGLGELGRASARALAALGFPVRGWSRTPRALPGVHCLHGPKALPEVLAGSHILVALLPHTPATENLLDAERLALLPQSAVLVNAGRGSLVDEPALLAALDRGQLAHATLDVFRQEPLPPDHPFWTHPGVTVSPHVSAATRPESACRRLVENIRRDQAGLGLMHVVERARGY